MLHFFSLRRHLKASISFGSVTASHSQPVTPLQACPRRLSVRDAARRTPDPYPDQRRLPARLTSDAHDTDVTQLASQRDGALARHVRDGARPSSRSLTRTVLEPALHPDGGRGPGGHDNHVARDDPSSRTGFQSTRGIGRVGKNTCTPMLKRGN